MPSELEQIKQIFNNFRIPLSMEWLESCIEWCKSDNLPPNYTLKNLQNMVYEQWLLLDLRDVEIASLPRNLSMEKKYSLPDIYYLQLMQVLDISKPKLWQLQRIRNNVAKNTEAEKDFGKRVLQLTLTDGVQEIQAMEFKPIPCININMTPGTKLKIIGPVTVRNGRLMLEQDHVKNLGGSVDDLIVKFAAENVLARALGLEENPNPHVIDEKILDVTEANNTVQQNTTMRPNLNQINNTRNQNQTRNNLNTNNSVSRPNQSTKPPVNQPIPPEFEVDDELLRELEEDFEETSVKHFKSLNASMTSTQIPKPINIATRNSSNANRSNSYRGPSPDLFDDELLDDDLLNEHLNQLDQHETTGLSNDTTKRMTLSTVKNKKTIQDVAVSSTSLKPKEADEVITLDDTFDDIDIDSHLDHIDEEMANIPCSTQKINEFKETMKSPVLKQKTSTPKLKLASKKLAQSKLTFDRKLPSTSKRGFNLNIGDSDEEFDNSFSIHKPGEKRTSNTVPLDLPGISTKLNASSKSITSFNAPKIISSPASTVEKPMDVPKLSPLGPKIMSIEKLKKLQPNINMGKFKIKGKFLQVTEKLQTTESSFRLVITVTDDTGQLTLQVHSNIVADWAKIRPEKLAEVRERVMNKDKAASQIILQALHTLHDRCKSLDSILEVQITRGEKYPILINVINSL